MPRARPLSFQQKLMRHADIRTTINLYRDVVTEEMAEAQSKIAALALTARNQHAATPKLLKLAEACASRIRLQTENKELSGAQLANLVFISP